MDPNRGSFSYFDWFVYEFWRFVFVQQEVAKLAMTAIDYPPMQKGASFNLDAVKEKIAEAMETRAVVRSFKLGGGLRADRPAPNGDTGCKDQTLTRRFGANIFGRATAMG